LNLWLSVVLSIGLCFPTNAAKPVEVKAQPAKKVESQNATYQRMRMVRVMDREGWGEPVEAFRLLIPSDWKTDGGVRWVSDLGCPANIIQLQFKATAPDGVTGIEFLPSYTWASSDDPMMQTIIQQQAQSRMGCSFGPVVGAVDFLRQQLVPQLRPNARILSGEILQSATKTLQGSFAAMNQQYAANGLQAMRTGDVGRVRLAYTIGSREVEEWISAGVVANISVGLSTTGAMQGNLITQLPIDRAGHFRHARAEGATRLTGLPVFAHLPVGPGESPVRRGGDAVLREYRPDQRASQRGALTHLAGGASPHRKDPAGDL
jgi:hypothetical protein